MLPHLRLGRPPTSGEVAMVDLAPAAGWPGRACRGLIVTITYTIYRI
jgi:hypothetical protein